MCYLIGAEQLFLKSQVKVFEQRLRKCGVFFYYMPERKGSQMKYINRKQTLIVTGNTAPEFQQNLNDALNDLARKGFKHELQFNMAYGLCAYIIYEERFEEAETLADQYELKGETYKCYECPMYNPSPDRRVKYTTCKKGETHLSFLPRLRLVL